MDNSHDPKNREIFEVLKFYRGLILDLAEQALGSHEHWSHFRNRLLGLLGQKGFEGRLHEILNQQGMHHD